MKSWKSAVLFAVHAALITGCNGPNLACGDARKDTSMKQPPAPQPAFSAVAAAKPVPQGPAPVAKMREVEVTADRVAEGTALFATCAGCHGQQGAGMIGQGPRLNSETFLAAASDAFLRKTITNGRAGTTMVPWGTSLKPEQVDAVIAYLRSLQPSEPAQLDERPLDADLAHGEELFQSICYTCHGRTGAGYQETSNGTGIGRKAFLDSVSNGYVRYLVKHGKSQTQMRAFSGAKVSVAELSDQEIDDVIGYLRSQAW